MSLVWSQSCFELRTWLSHPPLCKPQGFLSTELVISSMPSPQPTIQKGTHKDVCAWFAISTTNPDWWVPSNGCRHGWVPQTQRPGWAISYDLPFISADCLLRKRKRTSSFFLNWTLSSWTSHWRNVGRRVPPWPPWDSSAQLSDHKIWKSSLQVLGGKRNKWRDWSWDVISSLYHKKGMEKLVSKWI